MSDSTVTLLLRQCTADGKTAADTQHDWAPALNRLNRQFQALGLPLQMVTNVVAVQQTNYKVLVAMQRLNQQLTSFNKKKLDSSLCFRLLGFPLAAPCVLR